MLDELDVIKHLCERFILFIKVNNFAKTVSISIGKINKQKMLSFSFLSLTRLICIVLFSFPPQIFYRIENTQSETFTEVQTRFYLAQIGTMCLLICSRPIARAIAAHIPKQ